jgi:serine/threonine protein kinase
LHTLVLGTGASYSVRRVPCSKFPYLKASWDEQFNKSKAFVAVKQPLLSGPEKLKWSADDDSAKRLYSVMLELRILQHKPIRRHPNIVTLHHFMWDTQNYADALAPSLVLEYAEFGPLEAFQRAGLLSLHADAKSKICLDIAEGLLVLHRCGVVHGDAKSSWVQLKNNLNYVEIH